MIKAALGNGGFPCVHMYREDMNGCYACLVILSGKKGIFKDKIEVDISNPDQFEIPTEGTFYKIKWNTIIKWIKNKNNNKNNN